MSTVVKSPLIVPELQSTNIAKQHTHSLDADHMYLVRHKILSDNSNTQHNSCESELLYNKDKY